MKKELGIFVLLIVLCVIVSLINPNFLLAINLQNLARQIGAFGIFSIGLGLVIITGGIELSVGSMMALLGVLMSMMLTEWKLGVIIAVLACAGIAMFLSFIHGLLITRVNMQPFIVTLGSMLMFRGVSQAIAKGGSLSLGDSTFRNLSENGPFKYGDTALVPHGSSPDLSGSISLSTGASAPRTVVPVSPSRPGTVPDPR